MRNSSLLLTAAAVAALAVVVGAQNKPDAPKKTPGVTAEMLANPSPDDWLMYSRTYDAQRFSPLKQITRQNVGQLHQVFKKELGMGNQESIPIVYRGVIYVVA